MKSLKKWIKNKGLGKSVTGLIPLVFTKGQLAKVMQDCADAVLERNRVIHAGQRTVGQSRLSPYLTSIREFCRVLNEYDPATA